MATSKSLSNFHTKLGTHKQKSYEMTQWWDLYLMHLFPTFLVTNSHILPQSFVVNPIPQCQYESYNISHSPHYGKPWGNSFGQAKGPI